jgi:hypothetical protein
LSVEEKSKGTKRKQEEVKEKNSSSSETPTKKAKVEALEKLTLQGILTFYFVSTN